MRRALPALLLAAATAAADADLSLRFEAGAADVELGRGFPLAVVRSWSRDLLPEEWNDRKLAPLVLRAEGVERREQGSRVEETRRFRAYAFSLSDVALRGVKLVAWPVQGGEKRTAVAEPLRIRVRRALDPAAPGAPELPGEPLREPFPWVLPALAATAAAAAGAWALARRRGSPPPPSASVEPPAPAHDRALLALRTLRARPPADLETARRQFVEASAIVRGYVRERLAVRALEMTTEEILRAVAPGGSLARFLGPCDRVKFSGRVPSAADRDRAFDAAEAFVRETA